jgi:hypothetical protein
MAGDAGRRLRAVVTVAPSSGRRAVRSISMAADRAPDRQHAGGDEALVERAHDVVGAERRTKKVPMIEVMMQRRRWRAAASCSCRFRRAAKKIAPAPWWRPSSPRRSRTGRPPCRRSRRRCRRRCRRWWPGCADHLPGMPASTLPTMSPPTSAPLVKMPPPRRAKIEISEAPKPSATSASMTCGRPARGRGRRSGARSSRRRRSARGRPPACR